MRDRCLCGLLTKHHRDARNRSLSCAEAKRQHPRASFRPRSFSSLLALSCAPWPKATLKEAIDHARKILEDNPHQDEAIVVQVIRRVRRQKTPLVVEKV